jgi:hypothetical protein
MVYVLCTEDFSFIKVGKSKNLKNRLNNIQVGCPYKLGLWAGIYTPIPNDVEKDLHGRLEDYHYRGEWFVPDDDCLDYILRYVSLTNKSVRGCISALL